MVNLQDFRLCIYKSRNTRCAASRKAAGSILDDVIGIFHWRNPSGRSMALESTKPLTEKKTRDILCGVKAAGA